MIWSSFQAVGGVGLSEQRCLHTAVSVTGVETENNDDGGQQPHRPQREEDASQPDSSAAAVPEVASSPPPILGETSETSVAATPSVQLWGPVKTAAEPGSTRLTDPVNGAVSPAAKKRGGGKEGAAGSKTSNTKDTDKTSGSRSSRGDDRRQGEGTGGHAGDDESGDLPVFESILIFGGVVGEAAVSGVSWAWWAKRDARPSGVLWQGCACR